MGAAEILAVLNSGDEMTSSEIAVLVNCSSASVKQAIRRLVKDISENITVRKMTAEEKEEKFGHKVGSRVFIYRMEEINE